MSNRSFLLLSLFVWAAPLSCERDHIPCDTRGPIRRSVEGVADFSLSLYHFNIQYVADGNTAVEDKIITQSFEPLLDLYLRHPAWSGDFEMQGLMVEAVARRFPRVLDKMQRLVARGQMELVSFHYSDQLFTAYPRTDMEKSWALNRTIFEDDCLSLSPVVFAQEGQFGEGMADFMAKHGASVALLPKNLFTFFFGEIPAAPVYTLRGTDVVVAGRPVNYKDGLVRTEWSYLNDGELLATGGMDPYFGTLFTYKPDALKKYEDGLVKRESEGYCICSISSYLDRVRSLGIEPAALPPVLDGVWQPDDTCNIFRWMGGIGEAFGSTERDNDVLTSAYRSRNELVAAETFLAYASGQGLDVGGESFSLTRGWKAQLHAEVSDATGWNPSPAEVAFSLANSRTSLGIAAFIVTTLKSRLSYPYVRINATTGAVERLDSLLRQSAPPAAPPLTVAVAAQDRITTVTWTRPSPSQWDLSVTFSPSTTRNRMIAVTFPRTSDHIVYSPALLEDELVDYLQEDFTLSATPDCDRTAALPLTNGLIGLGGNLFLITHNTAVHVAARVHKDLPEIVFMDETAQAGESHTWEFTVFSGSPVDALALANKINTRPIVER